MTGIAQGGSLLVAGFETFPASPLGTYTIAGDNFDLGNPTALTRAIEQVSLDGERIAGRRSANRLLKLVVVIRAATRQALDAAAGALEMAVNEDTWDVQWTPPHLTSESALPVVYEAYRAVTTIDYEVERLDPAYVTGAAFVRAIYIEAPAYPFGKSPLPTTVVATGGILQLLTFDGAVPGGGFGWYLGSDSTFLPRTSEGAGVLTTADKTQGTGSWTATSTGGSSVVHVELSLQTLIAAPVDLSSYARIAVDVKTLNGTGPLQWKLNVSDGTLTKFTSVTNAPSGGWQTLSFPIPTVDKTHVISIGLYSFGVTPTGGAPVVLIDNVRALPPSSSSVSVVNGGTYKFAGVPGTARTNASVTAQSALGQTFGALVAHRAPEEARDDYTPLVPLSLGTAPPYTVSLPSYGGSTGGQRWDGTHAVWLGGVTLNGSGARTITVTFTETGIGTVVVSRSVTPATDLHNGLLWLGVIELPLRGTPDGSTDLADSGAAVVWSVTINSGNTADRFSDLLVLDVRGPTVIFTEGNTNAYLAIDEPLPTTGIGEVYQGTATNLLFACPDDALISGGPFTFDPGDNTALFYSPQGSPSVSATFHPRWLSTRNA